MPGHNNSITARNHKAAKEMETLLWRAMCDDMEDAKEYIAPDCVMMNPLLSNDTLHKAGTSVQDALDRANPFEAYKIMDKDQLQVVEIDMMAVQVLYRGAITLPGGREVTARCASTWRQGAGGDWLLCGQLVAPEE